MRPFTARLGAALTVAACVLPAARAQPPQPVVIQPAPPPGAVVVQPAPPPGAVVPPAVPAMLDDRLFAMAAGAGGLAEVVSSQAALTRSRDEEVRKFAQQMVTDHTQANQQLAQVVANKGIGLPATLDIKDQAAAGAMSMLQGEAFDREYLRYQVAAHMGMVQLFQAEAQHGMDPEIKGFATQTLPKLQQHLQMARQLMGRGGGER